MNLKNYTTKVLLNIICCLFFNFLSAQTVEVIKNSNLKKLPKGKKYAFIEPSTDTTQIQYVATILAKVKTSKSVIESLYFAIREESIELGANCYKLKSFNRDTLENQAVLILSSYVAPESVLNQNTANHEKNVVFVFGNEKEYDKSVSFEINGETKEINSGTYLKFILKQGEELKLSKGGFTGAKRWLNWEKDKQPEFYSLSGFGLSDFSQQPMNGISFTTGKISSIGNISLGLLLMQLLKQGN